MINSPIEASYLCNLRLIGSTSHLINEKENGVRDHSSIIDDSKMYGAIVVQQYGQQDVWCNNGVAEWTTKRMVQQWCSSMDSKMFVGVVGQQCYMVLQ